MRICVRYECNNTSQHIDFQETLHNEHLKRHPTAFAKMKVPGVNFFLKHSVDQLQLCIIHSIIIITDAGSADRQTQKKDQNGSNSWFFRKWIDLNWFAKNELATPFELQIRMHCYMGQIDQQWRQANLEKNEPPDWRAECNDKECICHVSTRKQDKLQQRDEVDKEPASAPFPRPCLNNGVHQHQRHQDTNSNCYITLVFFQRHGVLHTKTNLNPKNTNIKHFIKTLGATQPPVGGAKANATVNHADRAYPMYFAWP